MRTVGIICEYNPFHAGHAYQIAEARERLDPDTVIICLMSGNYVQRGEPAIYEKYKRAGDAMHGGADLVLELPLTISVNAAGYFAFGAVDCLNRLGFVDYLCFGSEYADGTALRNTAEIMLQPSYETALQKALQDGVSYARARENALIALGGDAQCLRTPNSALGVDYLRRLLQTGSRMAPLIISRQQDYPSAAALRSELAQNQAESIHRLEYGEKAMLAILRTLPDAAFEAMPFGSEGLWRKVMREARRGADMESILSACKSKRYTWSRLKRALLCLFLGISEKDQQQEPPYLRVLAFNETGRKLLHQAKIDSHCVLISGIVPKDSISQAYSAMEQRAENLYDLFAAVPVMPEKRELPLFFREETCIKESPTLR